MKKLAAAIARNLILSVVLIVGLSAFALSGGSADVEVKPTDVASKPTSVDFKPTDVDVKSIVVDANPSDVEVKRDKDGFLEGRNYKADGSCWVILFVRVLPPAETVYFNYLDDGWKKQQEALKQAGIIRSYKVLYTNMVHKNDYNVMLMTEYKDRATLDEAQQGAYDAVNRQISGSDEKVVLAFRERAYMRTLLGGKISKEVILR